MARPLRIEFEGAWYHVMNRGAARRDVFVSDTQRERFIQLLADLVDRFGIATHAYCLMGNHYHLLLHTPLGNLGRGMRHLNGVYTQFFNRDQGRDGALFRGRYKAILVDADAYLLHLSSYIHRNPLEAGMVECLTNYPWSSYAAYAGQTKPPPWLVATWSIRCSTARPNATGRSSKRASTKTSQRSTEGSRFLRFWGTKGSSNRCSNDTGVMIQK